GDTGESALANVRMDTIHALTRGPYTPKAPLNPRIDLSNSPNHLFRRAVRLVNGQNLSRTGTGSLTATLGLNQNRGITIATENPAYVQGNYNTGIPTTFGSPTPPANYPGPQVPCSVVADAVTVLSNAWTDAISYLSPYNPGGRAASTTAYRFAVLTGRPRSGLFNGANDDPMWGVVGTNPRNEPDDTRLYGGVHNFLRYIENWGGQRLTYTGALIDGWDSWQANGTFKCCNTVYQPPTRDYTFNTAYLDPKQLPPGTPNLQYLLLTSFRQNINPR
ncbi:MAG: hypothetical protein JNN15_18955, partial [Blastocatellia bacterium]|nr:hypothetical protein [Blastocatellia bacterium]